VNKLSHAGYRFAVHKPPLPDDLVKELRSVSDEWLAAMHSSEKGFSLGWFDEEYVRNAAVGVVYTPAGQVSAFASLVPEYQADEIAVDLMRRRRETENGSMEFLFVSLFQWAKEQQYHRFNLGLSALSGVGNQADDPTVERIMRFIYEHVNQFYHFKGLHSFKEKFHPEWSPRYLIYSGRMNLAQTWLAVIQANSGQSSVFMRPAAKIKELLIRTNSVQKGLYGAPRTTPHIE
jgi:phosphatidylglycerol lysyltransferase